MRNNTVVIAEDLAGGMGFQGGLPWPHCPEDMKFFASVTEGENLVMGSTTYKSMEGKMTWGSRTPWVVTRYPHKFPYAEIMPPRELVETLGGEKPFTIIGGASLVNAEDIWETVGEAFITVFQGLYECDTFFHNEGMQYIEDHFTLVSVTELAEGVNVSHFRRVT